MGDVNKLLLRFNHVLLLATATVFFTEVNSFYISPHTAAAEKSFPELKNLQSKLDMILDTETSEKKMLQTLLFENSLNDDNNNAHDSGHSGIEKTSTFADQLPLLETKALSVDVNGDAGEIVLGHPEPAAETKLKLPLSESVLRELNDNSKRMASMMNLMDDFKGILNNAITMQDKQLGLKNEVMELRDEVNYLRQELQKVKSEKALSQDSDFGKESTIQAKLQNDKQTIEWLKNTVTELRHEIIDVSSSLNITGLLHLKQQVEQNKKSTRRDLAGLQKQIEKLQLASDRKTEELLEVKGDVADVRTWQAKIGQKLVQKDTRFTVLDDLEKNFVDQSEPTESSMDAKANVLERKLAAIGKELEDTLKNEIDSSSSSSSFQSLSHPSIRHHQKRHSSSRKSHGTKKIETELKRLQKIVLEIVQDQKLLSKRLLKLEEMNRINIDSAEEEDEEFSIGLGQRRSKRTRRQEERVLHEPEIQSSSKISSLEKSVSDYSNTLELLDNKIEGLTSLHETTKSIFTSLESIETKYDIKITDLQSTMAKVEATISSLTVVTDETKEQQNLQLLLNTNVKKDGKNLIAGLESMNFKLASLQNEILKWGLRTCENSNVKSIHDIKLASLGEPN